MGSAAAFLARARTRDDPVHAAVKRSKCSSPAFPDNAVLHRWGIKPSAACTLCSHPASHIQCLCPIQIPISMLSTVPFMSILSCQARQAAINLCRHCARSAQSRHSHACKHPSLNFRCRCRRGAVGLLLPLRLRLLVLVAGLAHAANICRHDRDCTRTQCTSDVGNSSLTGLNRRTAPPVFANSWDGEEGGWGGGPAAGRHRPRVRPGRPLR